MNNSFSNQGQKPFTNLHQDINAVLFRKVLSWFNKLRQITIAEFLNDIVVFGSLHDIPKANYVIAFDHLHDLDLVAQGQFHILIAVDYIR